jgi:hypothetical protein
MPDAAWARTFTAAVDRAVRDRARLPTLTLD